MRPRAADRRYGVVLDGTVLTSATTERGKVVAAGTLIADSSHDALRRWWERVRPRGQVTVAVISDAAQVATVEVAQDVPPGLVRRHVESRLQSTSAGLSATFAVAARLPEGSGSSSTCVAAVPVEVMEELWQAGGAGVRYTVPAMAFTVGGLHLVVAHTASELVLVDGRSGQPVDSVLLASGGIAPDADPATRSAHAERVAEEVDRAIESWRRRGLPVDADIVHVTGGGATGEDLFGALALRGYRPRLDPVTDRLEPDALAVLRSDPTALLRCALAAAVAVCDPGPLGYLTPPGPRRTSLPTVHARQWLQRVNHGASARTGLPTRRRLRRSVLLGLVIAALGAACAAWIVPADIGSHTADVALARLQASSALERRLAPDISLATHDRWGAAQRARLAGPDWSTSIPAVLATLPAGVTIQTLDVNGEGDQLEMEVTATALNAGLVPLWLVQLAHAGVTASTPGVTVDRSGTATFTTTFGVPRGFA